MDEQQLLIAMSKVIDEKINVLENKMDEKFNALEIKMDENMEKQTKQIEDRITRLEVSYENKTDRILKLLEEDYSRVDAAAKKVRDYDDVKSTVSDHDHALKNHNERLTKLEEKAI